MSNEQERLTMGLSHYLYSLFPEVWEPQQQWGLQAASLNDKYVKTCSKTTQWIRCRQSYSLPCSVITCVYDLDPHDTYLVSGSPVGLACSKDHLHSFVPRPILSFSMLHAEKREGLIRSVTCVTRSQCTAASEKVASGSCPFLTIKFERKVCWYVNH